MVPHEEHKKFEPIIVEATRRFVTAVKREIKQWDIDHRHPVYAYTPKYLYQDQNLGTEFPTIGNNLIPEEVAKGILSTAWSDLHGELTKDVWDELANEITTPAKFAHYDEALFDAKTFRAALRYDIGVLYAAFAAETILQEVSTNLLKAKAGLTEKQIDMVLKDLHTDSLIALAEGLLDSELPRLNGYKLKKLFELRNAIAHKKKTTATGDEATGAIRAVEKLKEMV